jgi:hypothetical protein
VNWTRAVHHLDALARSCADMATRPATIFPLRVRQLWAVGDLLGPARDDLDSITVALCVDRPEVPWLSEPPGAQHWANATRMAQNPVIAWWRSADEPVWNHRIDRPALVWDAESGVAEDALAAIRDGKGESVRSAAPDGATYRARLARELEVSLRSLRDQSREYDDRRWRPGKLEPIADALWRASDGYLDVLKAAGEAAAGRSRSGVEGA